MKSGKGGPQCASKGAFHMNASYGRPPPIVNWGFSFQISTLHCTSLIVEATESGHPHLGRHDGDLKSNTEENGLVLVQKLDTLSV